MLLIYGDNIGSNVDPMSAWSSAKTEADFKSKGSTGWASTIVLPGSVVDE
jgi:hypothetical protein